MSLTGYWRDHPDKVERVWKLWNALELDTGERLDTAAEQWERDAYAWTLGLPGAPGVELDMGEVCGPVGCGKDQIIAAVFLALLKYGPEGVRGLKQSTSKDKSKEVVRSVRDFIARNPDVGHAVTVVRSEIRCVCPGCAKPNCEGTGTCIGSRRGVVECASLDGPTASGARADLFICNEVQEWPKPHGSEVYDHLFARYHKRGGRFACFTNAPFTPRGEWRRDRWEEARREGSDWHFRQVTIEECPWITPEILAKKRRNMTPQKFRRWFFCEPTDGRGELITKDQYRRSEFPELAPAVGPERVGRRFLGVDIGVMRDHTSMVLLSVTPEHAVFLERVDVWVPGEGKQVSLADVERKVLEYGLRWRALVFYDPSQALEMMQRAERAGVRTEAIWPSGAPMREAVPAVRSLFVDGRLRAFPNAGRTRIRDELYTDLCQQLVDAEVSDTTGIERIVHRRTAAGHGDIASAFALAALAVARAGLGGNVYAAGGSDDEKKPGAKARPARESIRDRFDRHFKTATSWRQRAAAGRT